jgi:hypothetical protein
MRPQGVEELRNDVTPRFLPNGGVSRLCCLFRRLLCGEARPLMVAVVERVACVAEIRLGLPEPIRSTSAHPSKIADPALERYPSETGRAAGPSWW